MHLINLIFCGFVNIFLQIQKLKIKRQSFYIIEQKYCDTIRVLLNIIKPTPCLSAGEYYII